MAIVIKKKVSLEFLGEDYKDAFLIFQSIPIVDFDKLVDEIEEAQGSKQSSAKILSTLKKYFLDGSFPGIAKLVADDLDGLDQETVIKCFSIFTGQEINKEEGTEAAETAALKPVSSTPSTMTGDQPES